MRSRVLYCKWAKVSVSGIVSATGLRRTHRPCPGPRPRDSSPWWVVAGSAYCSGARCNLHQFPKMQMKKKVGYHHHFYCKNKCLQLPKTTRVKQSCYINPLLKYCKKINYQGLARKYDEQSKFKRRDKIISSKHYFVHANTSYFRIQKQITQITR